MPFVPDPFFNHNGEGKAKALIPVLVEHMKAKWPDAKTFGATVHYIADAVAGYDREQHRTERERMEQLLRQKEQEEADRRRRERENFQAKWTAVWQALPPAEQEDIRQAVVAKNRHLLKAPKILDRLCLHELARRRTPEGAAA